MLIDTFCETNYCKYFPKFGPMHEGHFMYWQYGLEANDCFYIIPLFRKISHLFIEP